MIIYQFFINCLQVDLIYLIKINRLKISDIIILNYTDIFLNII